MLEETPLAKGQGEKGMKLNGMVEFYLTYVTREANPSDYCDEGAILSCKSL